MILKLKKKKTNNMKKKSVKLKNNLQKNVKIYTKKCQKENKNVLFN